MAPLFIINPHSSRVRKKGSVLVPIATKMNASIIQIQALKTFKSEFHKTLRDKPEHIFIEGGDGTAHIILTEYFRQLASHEVPAKFTLICGGTTNQVSTMIGLKKASEKRIMAIIQGKTNNIHKLPLLKLSLGEPANNNHSQEFYGFLFSSGAIPMATEYYHQQIMDNNGATFSVVVTTILKALGRGTEKEKSFINPSPVKLRISSPKNEIIIEENHLGTIATTLPGFIPGVDPFWGKEDAPLRITYVRGNTTQLIRLICTVALRQFKKLDATDGIESWNADLLQLQYDGPTVLDGEKLPYTHSPIHISASQLVTFLS